MQQIRARFPRRLLRAAAFAMTALMAAGLLLVGLPTTAQAEEEQTTQANLLVVQSVSLIANNALPETVAERLTDALGAPDTSGVDLAKVQQALTLVESAVSTGNPAGDQGGAMAQARTLLAGAVDIRSATGYGQIPQPGEVGQEVSPYAAGAQSGTTVVLDELKPARGVSDAGDGVLLAVAVVLLLGGFYLARRWRPQHSIATLRRKSAELDDEPHRDLDGGNRP